MDFKNAIFDLDGTLLDSMPVWDNIGVEYLKEKGINPPDNLQEILKPMGFVQCAEYFIHTLGLKMTVLDVVGEINDLVEYKYRHVIPLKENVKDFLEKLKRKSINICVATAMDKELALAAIKRTGINKYFSFIETCGELHLNKDTKEFFLQTAKRLHAKPSETIVFEDTLHSIISAKDAGFFVVGVYDLSSISDTYKIKEVCDKYITSFSEMEV